MLISSEAKLKKLLKKMCLTYNKLKDTKAFKCYKINLENIKKGNFKQFIKV